MTVFGKAPTMKANKIFMRAFGRADLAFSSFLLTMTPGMVIGKPGKPNYGDLACARSNQLT